MKINCLSCGHNIELDDAYADHYEGEIKCFACGARLEIRTDNSAIREVHLVSLPVEERANERPAGHRARNENVRVRSGGGQEYKAREESGHSGESGNESDTLHEPAGNRRSA